MLGHKDSLCNVIIEVFNLVQRNSLKYWKHSLLLAACDAAVTYAAAERCSSGLLQAASNNTGLAMAGPAEHWKASLLL